MPLEYSPVYSIKKRVGLYYPILVNFFTYKKVT